VCTGWKSARRGLEYSFDCSEAFSWQVGDRAVVDALVRSQLHERITNLSHLQVEFLSQPADLISVSSFLA